MKSAFAIPYQTGAKPPQSADDHVKSILSAPPATPASSKEQK